VTSYLQQYLAGEQRAVWAELGKLGAVPDELAEDVAAVARETMRRVARHAIRLDEALDGLGFVPVQRPVYQPPTEADRAEVNRLAAEIGGLPAALAACLREVGGLTLMGDCPALDLYYRRHPHVPAAMPPDAGYPDPLVLPPVEALCSEWDDYREDVEDDVEPFAFIFFFAPDELHKANVSGGTHDIELPDAVADPVLHGVAGRPGVTLVEYLRLSIGWGGFPGWSFAPERAPAALARLRVEPDF